MQSELSKKWDKEEEQLNKGYVLFNPLKRKSWLKYLIIAIIITIILYLII